MSDLFLNFGSSILNLTTNILSQNWVGVAVQAIKTLTTGSDLGSAIIDSSSQADGAADAAAGAGDTAEAAGNAEAAAGFSS